MLTIFDGEPGALPHIYQLDSQMTPQKLDAALHWLVQNRVTGKRFLELVNFQCGGSPLELVRYLTMRIEKEKHVRSLYIGKDIKL